jgi:hypothetical protein
MGRGEMAIVKAKHQVPDNAWPRPFVYIYTNHIHVRLAAGPRTRRRF